LIYFSDFMDSPTPFTPENTPVPLDVHQRDQFELLSAYLDGEVTPTERQQVEAWLATDPDCQRLYQRLRKLQFGFNQAPCPLKVSAETLANQVIHKANHRPRTLLAWTGAGAIAATAVVGVITNIFPGFLSPLPFNQTATADLTPTALQNSPSPDLYLPQNTMGLENKANLMLTLDRPPVAIPVSAPTSEPGLDRRTLNP
jgi:hypothetical protein